MAPEKLELALNAMRADAGAALLYSDMIRSQRSR